MTHELEITKPNFNLSLSGIKILSRVCMVSAIACCLTAHYGDGIEKKDICYDPPDIKKTEKFCNSTDYAPIPEPYFKAAQNQTANPKYNPYAYLAQHQPGTEGIKVIRDIPADNPYKIPFGAGAIVFALVGGWGFKKERQHLIENRTNYRSLLEEKRVEAKYKLAFKEELLAMSGKQLLVVLRGLKVAEARQNFLATITPFQRQTLLMAMSAEDYYEYGFLLDDGKSFNNYAPPAQQQTEVAGQLPHGTPGTVEEQTKQVTLQSAYGLAPEHQWLENFIEYPALIFGGMGSGKSWTTREIVRLKKAAGWNIVVLDPHGSPAEWKGLRLISGYKEIGDYLNWYMQEMLDRYQAFRESGLSEEEWQKKLITEKKHFCVVCEEFTNWADRVAKATGNAALVSEFFRCAMTDSRKQLMPPVFVSHDRTMAVLGDVKGLSNLRDSSLLELMLIPQVDPVTKKPLASGLGMMKLPGWNAQQKDNWLKIQLPKLAQKTTDFRTDSQKEVDGRDYLERVYNMEFDVKSSSGERTLETKEPSKAKLSETAQQLYAFLKRTSRKKAFVSEVQPNFKVKGQRFTADDIKRWFKEIVDARLAAWVGEGVIELKDF